MKCGTTASIFAFLYLRELCDELHGRLTLSALSDEETFGPYGARYLRASPGRGFWTGESRYAPGPPSIEIVRLPLPSRGGLCSFDV
jgi:acetylornithine deacetylase/succinyl-diaminopimelate desuccinylase-like protein